MLDKACEYLYGGNLFKFLRFLYYCLAISTDAEDYEDENVLGQAK